MSLEPIEPPETELTGEEIIEDAASRLVEALRRSCYLTATCAYRSYSGRITAELQLSDFDTTTVTATAVIVNPDPARPNEHFAVEIPTASHAIVRERSELTAPSLERFEETQIPTKREKRRYYIPRSARSKVGT
jgi:hypothetical protein